MGHFFEKECGKTAPCTFGIHKSVLLLLLELTVLEKRESGTLDLYKLIVDDGHIFCPCFSRLVL